MVCDFYACHEEFPVCRQCLSRFQDLLNEKCKNCGKTAYSCECSDNKDVRFLFFYGSFLSKKLLYFLKYNADLRVVDFMMELAVRATGINPESYDAVTYIPRSKRRIRRYGLDQSKEFAKAVSKIYGIPLVTCLERVGKGEQKLLSRAERYKNIRDKYRVKNLPEEKFKRILLIDDVCTTGATINLCADLLRKDVAKTVTPMVLTKTVLPKNNGTSRK